MNTLLKTSLLSVSVILLVALSSCTTLNQDVSFAPLNTPVAVSASSALLIGEKVFQQSDLTVVKTFTFTKTISAKMAVKSIPMLLEDDLAKLLKDNKGDAITGLKISIKDVNTTNVELVNLERWSGVAFAVVGVFFLVNGNVSIAQDTTVTTAVPGITLSLIGLSGIGGSFLQENLGTIDYTVIVDGNVIQVPKLAKN